MSLSRAAMGGKKICAGGFLANVYSPPVNPGNIRHQYHGE
jgi:hypothetical protein